MTDNTPLNADDELREKIYSRLIKLANNHMDYGFNLHPEVNMKDVIFTASEIEGIIKKHKLQARLDTLMGIKSSFSDLQNDEEAVHIESNTIDPWVHQIKQELESYE